MQRFPSEADQDDRAHGTFKKIFKGHKKLTKPREDLSVSLLRENSIVLQATPPEADFHGPQLLLGHQTTNRIGVDRK